MKSISEIKEIFNNADIKSIPNLIEEFSSDERKGVQNIIASGKKNYDKYIAELERLEVISAFEKVCFSRYRIYWWYRRSRQRTFGWTSSYSLCNFACRL